MPSFETFYNLHSYYIYSIKLVAILVLFNTVSVATETFDIDNASGDICTIEIRC